MLSISSHILVQCEIDTDKLARWKLARCMAKWWNDIRVTIGSGYGLVPNRRQAITWINDELFSNGHKFQWTSIKIDVLRQKNPFQNVVSKTAAILFVPHIVIWCSAGPHVRVGPSNGLLDSQCKKVMTPVMWSDSHRWLDGTCVMGEQVVEQK